MAPQNPSGNSAALRVTPGPLVGPILTRLVEMMAARASCPLDRLENALLVADALAAHGPAHAVDGSMRLVIRTAERSLELSVGPLRPDGGSALLAETAIPGVGNVLERMAEVVSVAPDPQGEGELLVLRIDFDSADVSGEPVSSG
jgi:hypothetical protein